MNNRRRVAEIRKAAKDLTSPRASKKQKAKASAVLMDSIDMELGLITNPTRKQKSKR